MRDPDIPRRPGWYRCLLKDAMSGEESWGAIEATEKSWGLRAAHLGSDMDLDAGCFIKWGTRISMPDEQEAEPQA